MMLYQVQFFDLIDFNLTQDKTSQRIFVIVFFSLLTLSLAMGKLFKDLLGKQHSLSFYLSCVHGLAVNCVCFRSQIKAAVFLRFSSSWHNRHREASDTRVDPINICSRE